MYKRILVIANKWFEADPLMGVLANPIARPKDITSLSDLSWPRAEPLSTGIIVKPRAQVRIRDASIEIWCIQDLMDPKAEGGYSSTSEKARILPEMFAFGSSAHVPAAVVAFGTGSTVTDDSFNGCVTVGTNCFLHNPYANNADKSQSKWSVPEMMDRVLPSSFPSSAFDVLSTFSPPVSEINKRCLHPLGNPSPNPTMLWDRNGVAVSSVNVVDRNQFETTDPDALNAAMAHGVEPILSLESTHGVIRAQSDAPFLFVSGITNRLGHYPDENLAFPYTQNFVAAHNAAISLTWMLPWIVDAL